MANIYVLIHRVSEKYPWRADGVYIEKRIAENAKEIAESQDSEPKNEHRIIEGQFLQTETMAEADKRLGEF
jgi:hypothetical protein